MATNYFIKLDGIEGESRDKAHTGWIEMYNFNSTVSNPTQMGSERGGSGAVRPNFGDFMFSKTVDKSSPNFSAYCASGKAIPSVEVHCCTTINEEQMVYMSYKFTDALISSASVSGAMDQLPMEDVSIAFGDVEWKYTAYDEKGSSKGDTIKGHELISNTSR